MTTIKHTNSNYLIILPTISPFGINGNILEKLFKCQYVPNMLSYRLKKQIIITQHILETYHFIYVFEKYLHPLSLHLQIVQYMYLISPKVQCLLTFFSPYVRYQYTISPYLFPFGINDKGVKIFKRNIMFSSILRMLHHCSTFRQFSFTNN